MAKKEEPKQDLPFFKRSQIHAEYTRALNVVCAVLRKNMKNPKYKVARVRNLEMELDIPDYGTDDDIEACVSYDYASDVDEVFDFNDDSAKEIEKKLSTMGYWLRTSCYDDSATFSVFKEDDDEAKCIAFRFGEHDEQ